jgi:spore maturation protein CgeB
MYTTQYKVLLITELANPWNNGWFYKLGLEQNGHEVIPFDPETVEAPLDKIKEIIGIHDPDFILHAKDELSAEAFLELRKMIKVIMWYPDPVIPGWLLPYVKASDVFLTMSEGLVAEFKKYNPNVFWLTQAFEPSSFEIRGITQKDERFYSSDVAFVGNLGSKAQYLERRRALERVIDAGLRMKWWGPRIPRKFSTLPLIFGKLGRAYGGKFVWGEEYAKIARLAKVFLAFDSMPHIKKSMSARMYTAVGCGAFYMCRHVDGIEEVLNPGKEIVTFQSCEEMIDLLRYYVDKDALRRKISDAGRKRIMREHTYATRMKQLTDIIKDFF